MDITLGAKVVACDDVQRGYVDRLVIEPDRGALFGIITHQGHSVSQDRVIELGFIDHTGPDDTVHLRLSADAADRLPRFVEHEFVTPTPIQHRSLPYPLTAAISGGSVAVLPILWRSTHAGHGYQPASRSLLESAAVDQGVIQIVSNLPGDALLVGKRTDVITRDGMQLGRISDIACSIDGTITGFVVRAGRFHYHDISVPAELVEVITHKQIRLRVTADDVAGLASGLGFATVASGPAPT